MCGGPKHPRLIPESKRSELRVEKALGIVWHCESVCIKHPLTIMYILFSILTVALMKSAAGLEKDNTLNMYHISFYIVSELCSC